MSAKVTLLDIQGRNPEQHKRSRIEAMERQLKVRRIHKYLYQRVAILAAAEILKRGYIPATLPPAEVEGITFSDPVKNLDILNHRRSLVLQARYLAISSL